MSKKITGKSNVDVIDLVTLTPPSNSDFERSNISLKENIPDDFDLNSNGLDYYVRKNGRKIVLFSADCISYLSFDCPGVIAWTT